MAAAAADYVAEELPFSHSQTLGSPSFRNAAVNFVAVVPLLSSRSSEGGSSSSSSATNHSSKSFDDLMTALRRYSGGGANQSHHPQKQLSPLPKDGTASPPSSSSTRDPRLVLVVPNSSLTRPGDWRYSDTPLRGFHWQHGCQRLEFGDGRPGRSRAAQDRILSAAARDWLDLCPSRRTSAVIGVLNLRDCHSGGVDDLRRAEEELHSWAARYSSPPYEVTALGRSFERDKPLERLFVFDSFDETCQNIDLSQSGMQDSLLAFPPIDGDEHRQMMDLHMNVVVNDLAVAIFRSLEARIQESDAICRLNVSALQLAQQEATAAAAASTASSSLSVRSSLTRIISGASTNSSAATASNKDEPVSAASRALSLNSLAGLVSPDSKLAKDSYAKSRSGGTPGGGGSGSPSASLVDPAAAASTATAPVSNSPASSAALHANTDIQKANSSPKLITPLDSYWERGGLSSKDVDAIRRRDLARREKWAGDVSLLAGSPLDAYERYLKAAEMCRSSATPDPLWYASALEGCAAAHIAMAEAGGYGVDEYLESNFSMPDEVVALLTVRRGEGDVAAASGSGSSATGSGKRGASGSTKQTLPEIVCALCEEALNITNRHEKLGPIHAELLLKLAGYVADSTVGHLRCRWGEGSGCYAGEVDQVPRWERHSVSKIKSPDPLPQHCVVGLDNMTTINTYNRTKQVCELLHEAASIASIDAATRVDVAASCVRLCLSGVKVTQWRGGSESEQVPLPRKAAFFAVVAAEAMTGANVEGSHQTARDLWLLATQLYANRPNVHGKDNSYGWVGLRAITLNALSLQGNNSTSLAAAEELLCLLSEIDPAHATSDTSTDGSTMFEVAGVSQLVSNHGARTSQTSAHGATSSHGKGYSSTQSSSHGTRTAQAVSTSVGKPPLDPATDSAGGESMNKKASSFARQLRDSFASLTSGSILLAMESRWAENDIIPAVDVPLSASAVQPLGCVWRLVHLNRCIDAQAQCLALISKLHRSLPTQSHGRSHPPPSVLPVYVSSVISMQAEADLELECVKKAVKKESGGSSDAMATFFNPFANQRNNRIQSAIVAEGEERAMCVELSNRLSIPVTVLRCQLEFRCDVPGSIRSTPLSFTIPPRATGFLVHFPFVVLPVDEPSQRIFEVTSISMTLAGRVVSIPFDSKAYSTIIKGATDRQIPAPASLYHRQVSSVSRSSSVKDDVSLELPRVESCPPQPRLQVHLAKDNVAVSIEKPIVVSLTEGELYTLPALRLTNYLGPAGLGSVERLQIFAVDVPGTADRMIYDSQVEMAPDPDFAPLIGRDQTPLKLRCLSSSIRISDLNCDEGSGTLVTIQISASHRIHQLMSKAASFKLRFRYRGAAGATREFWRRREIKFRVSCVPGPRMSSIDFRPDLLATKSYRDVCRILQAVPNDIQLNERIAALEPGDVDLSSISVFHRVGMDSSVHIASKEASFILTVSNDSNASLVLSREGGAAVGGFSKFPIPALLMDPGTTAKIPVIVPRISRISDAATADDLVDKVVGLTKLNWAVQRTQRDGETRSESYGENAQGCLSIPRACLMDIIEKNPSFVAHICEAPCEIELMLNNFSVAEASAAFAELGEPLSVSMKVHVANWLPQYGQDNCCMTLEFLCSDTNANESSLEGPQPSTRLGYVWCGKTRQSFELQGKDLEAASTQPFNHATKLVFCKSGAYALAACVRFRYKATSKCEVWLAPIIAEVSVGSKDQESRTGRLAAN